MFNLCSPERTPALNQRLANVLALVAGILNSVGFVAVATYTSHMTGIVASVADAIVAGPIEIVIAGVVAIFFFITGAATCALIFNWGRRRQLNGRYANIVLIEGCAMLVFGLVADAVTFSLRNYLIIAVLCFTMGMQNALITKVSGAAIRTTHVTGMVTDIGIELGKMAYRNSSTDQDPVRGDTKKLLMHTILVALFFGGGILGALGYVWFGFFTIIPPALALILIAIRPVLADLSSVRGTV